MAVKKKTKSKIEPKRMPYFEPEGMEENYKPKPMPYFEPEGMEEGGEVVVGKGKDYIKDLI